jgi:glutathione S-transferase
MGSSRVGRNRSSTRPCDSEVLRRTALEVARLLSVLSSINPRRSSVTQMMKSMTLYSGPLSMYGAKVQIAALEKGLPVHVVMVPFTDDDRYDPKHPQVLRINPKRQVPVLVHGDVEIFDSTQIFEYFEDLQPNPPLWPPAPSARALARLLELKSDEFFFPHVIRLMGMQGRLGEPQAQETIAQVHRYYGEMEIQLSDRDYLGGDYTYADIAFFMAQLFAARMGAAMGVESPQLLAWRARVMRRPAVRALVTELLKTLTDRGRLVPAFMRPAIDLRAP